MIEQLGEHLASSQGQPITSMKSRKHLIGTESKVTEKEMKVVGTVTPLQSRDHCISLTIESKSLRYASL